MIEVVAAVIVVIAVGWALVERSAAASWCHLPKKEKKADAQPG